MARSVIDSQVQYFDSNYIKKFTDDKSDPTKDSLDPKLRMTRYLLEQTQSTVQQADPLIIDLKGNGVFSNGQKRKRVN